MSISRKQDDEIGSELSGMIFNNVNLARKYLDLQDYNMTLVVLRISASSGLVGGITEARLTEELGFSRSGMNRILKRLVDLGHIQAIPNTSPRRYVYTNGHAKRLYGRDEVQLRRAAHLNVIKRCVEALLIILEGSLDSQFDNEDD